MQSTKEADEFYQRKLDYVSENIEKMQKAMVEKHKMRESKEDWAIVELFESFFLHSLSAAILVTMQMKVMTLKGQTKS